ncbi:non-functional NADPH-dependent codeinone reductase 2 [Cannabis sativa]|uniref:non-functional NADPH-dependent codeinone reductase 2 n=1 Tax=Cannabis sativa TaxID=3483 RepID=UPI0029CA90CC|nr:non-functional NADPH-dependent codeinone reductase 2 [Cannabis sativa]
MEKIIVPDLVIKSSSGGEVKIPVIGFGTAVFPPMELETKEAIIEAMKLGYRHFDTASVYLIEHVLGQAISEAISMGLIQSRAQLFITSKLWCGDAHHDRVIPAIQKTLKNLRMDYLDQYLIHWAVALKPSEPNFVFSRDDVIPLDIKSVWEKMEECQTLGLTKTIGVSNFSCKKLQTLLATAKIPPAFNQVELNPVWQQRKLREFCKEKGILITAYSPLGGKGSIWGTNRVMENDVLKQIAEAKGKTVAQVCLRWAYEQGICFVMKSFNKKRMQENLDIFDWSLTPNELLLIDQIPQQRSYGGQHFCSSAQEFWDGEI